MIFEIMTQIVAELNFQTIETEWHYESHFGQFSKFL